MRAQLIFIRRVTDYNADHPTTRRSLFVLSDLIKTKSCQNMHFIKYIAIKAPNGLRALFFNHPSNFTLQFSVVYRKVTQILLCDTSISFSQVQTV